MARKEDVCERVCMCVWIYLNIMSFYEYNSYVILTMTGLT